MADIYARSTHVKKETLLITFLRDSGNLPTYVFNACRLQYVNIYATVEIHLYRAGPKNLKRLLLYAQKDSSYSYSLNERAIGAHFNGTPNSVSLKFLLLPFPPFVACRLRI